MAQVLNYLEPHCFFHHPQNMHFTTVKQQNIDSLDHSCVSRFMLDSQEVSLLRGLKNEFFRSGFSDQVLFFRDVKNETSQKSIYMNLSIRFDSFSNRSAFYSMPADSVPCTAIHCNETFAKDLKEGQFLQFSSGFTLRLCF